MPFLSFLLNSTFQGEPEPVSAAIEIEEEEVPQQWGKDRASDIRALKAALIAEVAGLDRGFAAVVSPNPILSLLKRLLHSAKRHSENSKHHPKHRNHFRFRRSDRHRFRKATQWTRNV